MSKPTDLALTARALTALLLSLLAAGANGQAPGPSGQERATLTDSLDVRVVNVDVTVIDRKGEPVTGLEARDFVLLEDGSQVPITNFYATGSAGAPQTQARSQAGAPEREGIGTTSEPLTLAIYFDERNTLPAHLSRVRQDLESFLRGGHLQEAEVLVATYRDRLQILSTPSSDPNVAIDALQLDKGFAQGVDSERARSRVLSQIRDSYISCENTAFCQVCVDNWEEMLAFARTYSASEQTRTAIGVSGIADLVAALAARDGKKALLYVGDGVQMRGGYSVFTYVAQICEGVRTQALNEVFRDQWEFDSNSRFSELTAYANANRVSFYMLDAGGVRQLSSIEFANGQLRPGTEVHQQRVENLQATHAVLAEETGGKALLNANRPLEALIDLAAEIGEGTYSLGFAPDHPRSGRIHLLEVRLAGKLGKGKRLRYRRSYLDKTVEAELVDDIVANLFLDQAKNPLGAQLNVLETRPLGRRRVEVDLQVLAPQSSFFEEKKSEGETRGQARLWLTAVNDRGQRADVRQELIELGPGGVEAENGIYAFVVTLELAKGVQTIAVGLRDELTRRRSVLRAEVDLRKETERP